MRITPVLVAVAGLLALSAFQNSPCKITSARAEDQPEAAAKIKRLEDKIAALEATQQKLLQRLHDLEFPELRHRDADEIRVLKLKVAAAQTERDRIALLREETIIGGETVLLVGAMHELASALAELAWAEGRIKDAVRHTATAAVYAKEQVREYLALWEIGVTRIGGSVFSAPVFLAAIEARAQARLAILRALTVARHAKVDVSDLKIEVTSLRTGTTEVKALADVLKTLHESAFDEISSAKKD